jgi:hypothetical protein
MMKSFRQFLSEARGGKAAEQAQRSGLVSSGHGEWLNRQGLVVAKTEKDRLVFIKPQTPKRSEPEQEPKGKPITAGQRATPKPKKPQPLPKPKKQKKEEPVKDIDKPKSITVVFGKFNPPTAGHLLLLKKAREIAGGSELRIYPSRIQNDQNPLDVKNKIRYMRLAYPDFADDIMNDQDMETIFDVLTLLNEEGYNEVQIVVGSQRESEFDRLANQYNGNLYEFENIEVIPAGLKDPDSDSSDVQSSGALRKAAISNEYFKFRTGLPPKMQEKEKRNLFYAVQRYYEKTTVKEMWKVAPELDYKNLRENYYKGKIFNVGDLVESRSTGIVGEIKRRGPNYVICVNEKLDLMFKPWIEDISEWTNNQGTTYKEKEMGTPERLKYVMRLMGLKKIDNFIKPTKKSK